MDPTKKAFAHAAAKNSRIRKFMSDLNAEVHVDGTVVVFQNRNVKMDVPRASFYWDVKDLLQGLQSRVKPPPKSA